MALPHAALDSPSTFRLHPHAPEPFFVIMGVSGCGKSSVGSALASALQCSFYEGDSLHPPSNIAKMRGGVPLTEEDREPWLAALAQLIAAHYDGSRQAGEPAVLACSALRRSYRDVLREGAARGRAAAAAAAAAAPAAVAPAAPLAGIVAAVPPAACASTSRLDLSPAFVLLEPSHAELAARLAARSAAGGHFMPPSLLASQLATLEAPGDAADPIWLHLKQPPADQPFPSTEAIVQTILQHYADEVKHYDDPSGVR